MRKHNEPNCPCPWPLTCGLTPAWFDNAKYRWVDKLLLVLVLVAYFVSEYRHHGLTGVINVLAVGIILGIVLAVVVGILVRLKLIKEPF